MDANTSEDANDETAHFDTKYADLQEEKSELLRELSQAIEAVHKAQENEATALQELAKKDEKIAHLEEGRERQEVSGVRMREKFEDTLRANQREFAKQDEARRQQAGALAEAERKAAALSSERDSALALLKVRTEELRAAEVYLTKTDAVSDADVRRMVEGLNAEIFQSAAVIADTCQDRLPGSYPATPAEYPDAIYDRVACGIGHRILQVFHEAAGHVDPILIQVALQACIGKYAQELVAAWTLKTNEDDSVLKRVYERMIHNEATAVARRWRMLTRQYTRAFIEDAPNLVSSLVPSLAQRIADVLYVAGVPGQSPETIAQKHGERLNGLLVAILDLRKTVGEDVVASDFELLRPLERHDFDPTTMEDGFGKTGSRRPDTRIRVICTTELGLQRWEKVNGNGKGGKWSATIALKPKVVLETTMAELAVEREERNGRQRDEREMAGAR